MPPARKELPSRRVAKPLPGRPRSSGWSEVPMTSSMEVLPPEPLNSSGGSLRPLSASTALLPPTRMSDPPPRMLMHSHSTVSVSGASSVRHSTAGTPTVLRGITSAPQRPAMAMSFEQHRAGSPAPESPWRPSSGPHPALHTRASTAASSVDLGGSPGTFLTGTRLELDVATPRSSSVMMDGMDNDESVQASLPSPIHDTSPQAGSDTRVELYTEPSERYSGGRDDAPSDHVMARSMDNPMQSTDSLTARLDPLALMASDALHAACRARATVERATAQHEQRVAEEMEEGDGGVPAAEGSEGRERVQGLLRDAADRASIRDLLLQQLSASTTLASSMIVDASNEEQHVVEEEQEFTPEARREAQADGEGESQSCSPATSVCLSVNPMQSLDFSTASETGGALARARELHLEERRTQTPTHAEAEAEVEVEVASLRGSVATSAGNPLDDSGPLATSGGDGDLQSLREDLRSLLADAAAAAAAEWGERYDDEGNEVKEMDADSAAYDDDDDHGAAGGAFLTGVAGEEQTEAERVRDMQTMMQQLEARVRSQNDRRAELGQYMAQLQTHTDDTGGQVVLFPSDFTRLVEELFHSKLDGDRAADLQEERRALKGKAAAGTGGTLSDDEEEEDDPKAAAGREKIQRLDSILAQKTAVARGVDRTVHAEARREEDERRQAEREARAAASSERRARERKRQRQEARVRRVLRDLAKGVRNPESLPTAQLRNLAAVNHGPMAALFSLDPADEALVERLLGEPEEEDAVNPFEVDGSSIPAPNAEQGYSHGADAARLRQIEGQLRAYEMEHQWTEGGELADFNLRSFSTAAAGEQADPQGSSESMATAGGGDGGVSASSSTVVNNRTREQAEYYAAAKLLTGAAGGGGDGDAHLAAAREARAAAEAAEAVDRRLRALQTSALPVRLSSAAMAALVSECKAQQEASSSRPPASPPKVELEEDTAAAAAAASAGGDGRAVARADKAAAGAESKRERRASGRAERKAERTVVVEERATAEGGKVQENTAQKKPEERGVGQSAKAKVRTAERSTLAATVGGKVVRSERPSSSSDSGRSRELRPTCTPSSSTLRAERENRPVAASTANLPRPDLGLSGTSAVGSTASLIWKSAERPSNVKPRQSAPQTGYVSTGVHTTSTTSPRGVVGSRPVSGGRPPRPLSSGSSGSARGSGRHSGWLGSTTRPLSGGRAEGGLETLNPASDMSVVARAAPRTAA